MLVSVHITTGIIMDGLLNGPILGTGQGAHSVRGPLAFICKTSLKLTGSNQENTQKGTQTDAQELQGAT